MGLLGSLIKTAIDVVTIPVDVVMDVADTLDGEGPSHLQNKVKELGKDVKDSAEDLADGDLL